MRRPRSRWVLDRLTALLLCISIAASYGLGRRLAAARSGSVPNTQEATGTGLDRTVGHLHIADAPLEQVVDDLSRRTGQPIKVEWDEIHNDWGQIRQAPVTVDRDDVTLGSALQAVFGSVSAYEPVHFAVNHGVVMVSSRPQRWDVVVGTYDVGELVQRYADRSVPSTAQPAPVQAPTALFGGTGSFRGTGLFGGTAAPVYVYTTGRIGPAPVSPTPRDAALESLTELVYHTLRDDRVEGMTTPTVTQWSDRLIVVATEPQQRNLQRFLAALRAAHSAWADVRTGGD